MRLKDQYPPPVMGVSTLAPRSRPKGLAQTQVNFRSDPVSQLTRRPSSDKDVTYLTKSATDSVLVHKYNRKGKVYTVIIDRLTGVVHGYVDGVEVSGSMGTVINSTSNFVFSTVEDTTYITDTDRIVVLDGVADNDYPKATYINVVTALNYGETLTATVTLDGYPAIFGQYVVPTVGDETERPAADIARATSAAASGLSTALAAAAASASVPLVFGSNGSSMVAIHVDDTLDNVIEIKTGQGSKSAIAINRTIENVDGLPLFALEGTKVKIQPDPTTDVGSYYLEAVPVNDVVSSSLREVIWSECAEFGGIHNFNVASLPKQYTFTSDTTGELTNSTWKPRQAGDDDTVKQPAFVGSTITNMGYFQKRLVILTGDTVVMSEADDVDNFWLQSAVRGLDNDRISITSDALGVDVLSHVTTHNRDLLVIASNAQLKVGGSSGVSPTTVSLAVTTRYDCQTLAAPADLGNNVLLPISYGTSSGLRLYTAQANTQQDESSDISKHVVGMMAGDVKLIATNTNLDMVVLTTTESEDGILYVYEQYVTDGAARQRAWSTWDIGEGKIVNLHFVGTDLHITVERVLKSGPVAYENLVVKLYEDTDSYSNKVFLDRKWVASTAGTEITGISNNDMFDDTLVIAGDGTDFPLQRIPYTYIAGTITLDLDIGAGDVYIGRPFTSTYGVTRPFRMSESGIVDTGEKLRINRYIVSIEDTNRLTMHIKTDYTQWDDQQFNGRIVNDIGNLVGVKPFFSGDVGFSYGQDAAYSDAEFYCDNWLSCTITGISWEGKCIPAKRRL